MQDDEERARIPLDVRRFICCIRKVIRHSAQDFDKIRYRRYAHEFLPDDGDLCSAPSMQAYLERWAEQEAVPFLRSDGKGEPMVIHQADLADAIEELAPQEQDFLVRYFQEGLPIALYAAEEGISVSMAYRRKRALLDKLREAIMREDEME